MDWTERKVGQIENIASYQVCTQPHQAKCKWSKYESQNVELIRLDKQVLCHWMPLTKSELQISIYNQVNNKKKTV